MAKPIQETPILKGKDAKKFIEQNCASKSPIAVEAAQKERERILENYNRFKTAENGNRHITS